MRSAVDPMIPLVDDVVSSPSGPSPSNASVRLLVVPGLGGSPAGHWQTWLEGEVPHAVRVVQSDWNTPDLDRWAAQVGVTIEEAGDRCRWLVAAHSFGVLAILRYLQLYRDARIVAQLLVAPADPARFDLDGSMPHGPLSVPTTLVLSADDPWLGPSVGRTWAARWQVPVLDLGRSGHVNVASGFGQWDYARDWVSAQVEKLGRRTAAGSNARLSPVA